MSSGLEPGEPTARDLQVLALLHAREGSLTDVALSDGRHCRVWNIAWGYDAGDRWAHITTNISPDVNGEEIDFFVTKEVDAIRAPESGQILLGSVSPSPTERRPMRIFAFEEPAEVHTCESLAAAEAYFEAIDVANDEYLFFGDDGTVISPSVQDERVVLTPTSVRRPEELNERLRTFLLHPRVAMDPDLADDPAALADLLIGQVGRADRWPRWPAWLRLRRSR